jgi:hypothetical protein
MCVARFLVAAADIRKSDSRPSQVAGPLVVADCHHFGVRTAIADTASSLFKEIVNTFEVQ